MCVPPSVCRDSPQDLHFCSSQRWRKLVWAAESQTPKYLENTVKIKKNFPSTWSHTDAPVTRPQTQTHLDFKYEIISLTNSKSVKTKKRKITAFQVCYDRVCVFSAGGSPVTQPEPCRWKEASLWLPRAFWLQLNHWVTARGRGCVCVCSPGFRGRVCMFCMRERVAEWVSHQTATKAPPAAHNGKD